MNNEIEKKVLNFFSAYKKIQLGSKEVLIASDESQTNIYYLISGHVREYTISPHGQELTLHIFNPNSFFPMTWCLANIPNRYSFESQTAVEVYQASKEDVLRFLQKEPDVLEDLTKRLLLGTDKLLLRLEQLALNRAQTRLVSIIIFLARHFGEKTDKGILLNASFTHADLGALAALTRETVSREWEKLQEENLVKLQGDHILILDLASLESKNS